MAPGKLDLDAPLVRSPQAILPDLPNYLSTAEWSPDAKLILSIGDRGAQSVDPQSRRPIALWLEPSEVRATAWSPDGRNIAFCRALTPEPKPNRYAIYVVAASGGQERKVAEGGVGVSWAPDGKILALAGVPAEGSGIFLLSLETGDRTQLTSPQPYFDNLPVFSPDGRWIAFTRQRQVWRASRHWA